MAKRRGGTEARRKRERAGRRAEWLAAAWLMLKGYRILARRVRTPVGEIDLIARRGGTLVFVEVKARATLDSGVAALHTSALRRIEAASRLLRPRWPHLPHTRIDAVIVRPWAWPRHMVCVVREG